MEQKREFNCRDCSEYFFAWTYSDEERNYCENCVKMKLGFYNCGSCNTETHIDNCDNKRCKYCRILLCDICTECTECYKKNITHKQIIKDTKNEHCE
jgi:hypothetical protein